MHLDFFHSGSLTYFTSSASGIETEASWSISALLCLKGACEHFSHEGEKSGIGSDVRVWSFSDGGLVDDDRFIYLIESDDFLVLARLFGIVSEKTGNRVGKYVDDERRFSRSGHSRYDRHHSKRDSDVYLLEIVF